MEMRVYFMINSNKKQICKNIQWWKWNIQRSVFGLVQLD